MSLFRQIQIELQSGNLNITIPEKLEEAINFELDAEGNLIAYVFNAYNDKIDFSLSSTGMLLADIDEDSKIIISTKTITVSEISATEIYYKDDVWYADGTEIEDETILEQLNQLLNIEMSEGENNIYTTADVTLTLEYTNCTEIDINKFQDFKFSKESFKCTRIYYEDGLRQFEFGDKTGNTIYIDANNPYIIDEEQIENIYNALNGLELYGFEGSSIVDPAIEIGDIVYIDGKPILYQGSYQYLGRNKVSISSEINENTDNENVTTIKSETKIKQLQTLYNQQEGTITTLVNQVSDAEITITKLQLTTNSLSTTVEKKVGINDIIARINMAILGIEDTDIPDDVEKSIIQISSDLFELTSTYFTITKEGKITATSGEIGGLTLDSNRLYKNYTNSDKENYQSGIFIPNSTTGNTAFIYAGRPLDTDTASMYESNMFIMHNGSQFFRTGSLKMMYEPTVNDDGSASWQNALVFQSDGFYRYLSNGNTWCKYGTMYDSDGTEEGEAAVISDALYFGIWDKVHSTFLAKFIREDNSGNAAKIHLYKDTTITGSCIATTLYDGGGSYRVIRTNTESYPNYGISNMTAAINSNTNAISSLYFTNFTGNTAYINVSSTSDIRLKSNITDTEVTSALDVINKIGHYSFDMYGQHKQIGYIANYLQEIDEDFINTVNDKDYENLLILNENKIMPYVTKSIQELDEKVEKYKTIIKYLADKLNCETEVLELLEEES